MFLVVSTFIIGYMEDSDRKRRYCHESTKIAWRLMLRSMSSVITVHNIENRPKGGGICVSNHTTVIDVCVLSTITHFSLVKARLRNKDNYYHC